MVGKERKPQILVNLLVTNVPTCIGSNAKTLGLRLLQFPDMGASGGPPDGARIVHHRTDELLVQHITIPDGETTSPVEESSQHSQSLCRFLSYLIDMNQPGELCIKGHPKITDGIDRMEWLPEELNWSGF